MTSQRKEFRQESAKVRAELRASISDQQQLDRLNNLFGVDAGAKKERARLAKLIAGAAKKKASPPKEPKGKKRGESPAWEKEA